MIRFGGGIFQTRPDVLRLEIGIVLQDLCFLDSGGKKVQHVLHPDAHASDAWAAAALVRVEGDPVHHGDKVMHGFPDVKEVSISRFLCAAFSRRLNGATPRVTGKRKEVAQGGHRTKPNEETMNAETQSRFATSHFSPLPIKGKPPIPPSELASRGYVRTESIRAFTDEEFDTVLKA